MIILHLMHKYDMIVKNNETRETALSIIPATAKPTVTSRFYSISDVHVYTKYNNRLTELLLFCGNGSKFP